MKHVDRKNVNQLTAEERELIVNNAKEGIEQKIIESLRESNKNNLLARKLKVVWN